jgi:hypothetical protein
VFAWIGVWEEEGIEGGGGRKCALVRICVVAGPDVCVRVCTYV